MIWQSRHCHRFLCSYINQQFQIWRPWLKILKPGAEKLSQEALEPQDINAKLNFFLANGPNLELLYINSESGKGYYVEFLE
jgi:hypothetical protein